ncbi:MAG: DegT/DnrJ/EryC1/StrS family aminotransferase [Candidatus Kapabacteria bacterium]|nr:DegT/DnrJ/EryC1/StrS family aminotransferase [Ignavibacteriota bacterium]MCW5884157.1 DegT/DnrJ/EryC1/StrS family aminotransferase [Candidatus Kapabacteria bacterium]
MNFIDLKSQYNIIKDIVDSSLQNVLDHGAYIMGPEINQLESRLAEYASTKYALTCSSGTDALLLPLMAWGIGPGDAVFTSPITFIATAEVIHLLGATAVFVDIDSDTFNINPDKLNESIKQVNSEGKLTPKAIIPVDLFGLTADYDAINKIAESHNLYVLEDAAQSFGAEYKGNKSCSLAHCAATSFYPAKPLGCYGDGGAVFTDDEEMYKLLVSFRVHGQGEDRYNNDRIGINGRMDTMQAAILLAKLTIFDDEIKKRNEVAAKYSDLLNSKIITPIVPKGYLSVWAQYSVLAENSVQRERIMSHLKLNGIPSVIYYPKPLHLQKAFKNLNYKYGDFPVSESVSERIFSLPMHPYLKDEEIQLICDKIIEIL